MTGNAEHPPRALAGRIARGELPPERTGRHDHTDSHRHEPAGRPAMTKAADGGGLRKRQRGFAAVPNETVWDDELAARDLGILTKIIALPEDWDLSTEWLVKKCSEGRDAVMTSLRTLRRLGYYR